VLSEKQVHPGEQAFLFNIDRVSNSKKPQVLASASRIYHEAVSRDGYSFIAKSPLNTTNVMRILLPEQPTQVRVTNAAGLLVEAKTSWHSSSKTYFLSFENDPDG